MSTSTETPSRRAALGAIARISAFAFLPAGAAVAKTTEISPADARLIELDLRHAEAFEVNLKASESRRAAEDAVRHVVGFVPRKSIDYDRSDRSVRKQLRAHEKAVAVYRARTNQAQIEFRVAELSDAYDDANAALRLVEREVWETPAIGIAGLRAKAHMAKRSPGLAYAIVQDLIAMESANG
ncbi:MAG: hypothetical protein ABSF67_17240 [Roseiarcus sp.]|jgi:hypothetical protein